MKIDQINHIQRKKSPRIIPVEVAGRLFGRCSFDMGQDFTINLWLNLGSLRLFVTRIIDRN